MPLQLLNVSFSFGKSNVLLQDVNQTLKEGNTYALLGTNGAGKTTLLNIISGYLHPRNGEIKYDGKLLQRLPPFQVSRVGIGRTFQDLRLIGNLTVRENIELAFQQNLSDKWYYAILPNPHVRQQKKNISSQTSEILKEFYLSEIEHNFANEISYGQQKLLTLACCVATNATVLLLDEPVAGVTEIYKAQLVQIIKRLKEQGKIILLIEHNLDFVAQVADIVFFLTNGKITMYSSLAEMKQDKNVQDAYYNVTS